MTLAWRAESRKANFGPRLSLVADSMRLRLPRLPLVLLFAVAISTTAIAAASVSALPSGDASLLEKLWLERGTVRTIQVALDGLVVALFARAGAVPFAVIQLAAECLDRGSEGFFRRRGAHAASASAAGARRLALARRTM
eukprot:TRINITY_DN2319_c0_g1_i5.p1 TRINITY_DN2319_c0_g1~~TRINITY_DN2319_c0_g1_i5.p1  ORF type:complete len:140 (+),score=17.95 TRINITY_DN2319_c0_g1_i5:127-546(+)